MTDENTADEVEDEATDEEADEEQPVEPEVEVIPPTLEEQLAEALERVAKAEAEIGYRDANLHNQRKKSAQDRSSMIKYAGFNLARRMLSVMLDVDRALEMLSKDEAESSNEGLQLLRDRLWQELKAEGVTHIETGGQEFDPTVHEAISTIPASEEYASGVIVEVLEAGYRYKDRLLKASRVVVAS